MYEYVMIREKVEDPKEVLYMTKRLVQLICLLLCLSLLPVYAGAEPEEGPAPEVRVLLRRLGLTDRADLILEGAYTASVDGEVLMAFPEDAKVTVAIRSGELYLFYEGMRLRLGDEVTFLRNASEDIGNDGI